MPGENVEFKISRESASQDLSLWKQDKLFISVRERYVEDEVFKNFVKEFKPKHLQKINENKEY